VSKHLTHNLIALRVQIIECLVYLSNTDVNDIIRISLEA